SRRRHTRFSRDWSSDVCSSDLAPETDLVYGRGPIGTTVHFRELTGGSRVAAGATSGGRIGLGWLVTRVLVGPAERLVDRVLEGEIGRASCRERVAGMACKRQVW